MLGFTLIDCSENYQNAPEFIYLKIKKKDV